MGKRKICQVAHQENVGESPPRRLNATVCLSAEWPDKIILLYNILYLGKRKSRLSRLDTILFDKFQQIHPKSQLA